MQKLCDFFKHFGNLPKKIQSEKAKGENIVSNNNHRGQTLLSIHLVEYT